MCPEFKLWKGSPIKAEKLPLPDNITHSVVHRADKAYTFLLGADITSFKETLYCGWGNSRKDENDKWSIMAGRRSTDSGTTWNDFEIIAPGFNDKYAHSHGVFFQHKDVLYSLVPRAGYGQPCAMAFPDLVVEMFVLSENGQLWQSQGIIIDEPFWPMDKPQLTGNGNYIMPGLNCRSNKAFPAVAICDGNNIKHWRTVEIPVAPRPDTWGEGGIIVDGSEITCIFRNGWKHRPRAQYAISHDNGNSWTKAVDTNIPMSPAKPCCGMLSTGQRYLIFNPAPYGRDSLAIAVSTPGESQLSRAFRIRHGRSPEPTFKGCGKNCQWAYPLSCEHNGKLYIVYAASKEDCVMSTISVTALQ